MNSASNSYGNCLLLRLFVTCWTIDKTVYIIASVYRKCKGYELTRRKGLQHQYIRNKNKPFDMVNELTVTKSKDVILTINISYNVRIRKCLSQLFVRIKLNWPICKYRNNSRNELRVNVYKFSIQRFSKASLKRPTCLERLLMVVKVSEKELYEKN
ncbi:hypothetical protein BDF20DRAFT_833605 [Mycotypha africana]|uniref:uncharacterized protein n=1 Tax=Mycotypha africana TaxID=64632 RepID=UPI002300AB3E|nr:uncharacterized protein BDF20DRAFT_833605 [Mycotypha africana]KAI8984069.1 hypothetical protein BDF20DRAFT_833605 [Mycotypha africana]